MTTQRFALIWGILFLLAGVAGFIPPLLTPPEQPIAMNHMHGLLFGLFPVNVLHSLFHVAFGIWGIIASRSGFRAARLYAQVTAVVYAILVVLGFFPGLNTLFGLLPIHGHDIWLHAVLALPAFYFGFVNKSDTAAAATTTTTHTTGRRV
jgi:hypothetical protein